jgi:hypothetical protein
MNVINDWPPNIKAIRQVFDLKGLNPVFTYGDTLYNPGGEPIPPHLMAHERVHEKQQGANPAGWWERYLVDSDYRLRQEVEAYRAQWVVSEYLPRKERRLLFRAITHDLSGKMYGFLIPLEKAQFLIKNPDERIY